VEASALRRVVSRCIKDLAEDSRENIAKLQGPGTAEYDGMAGGRWARHILPLDTAYQGGVRAGLNALSLRR
jgi:hypothetical protein